MADGSSSRPRKRCLSGCTQARAGKLRFDDALPRPPLRRHGKRALFLRCTKPTHPVRPSKFHRRLDAGCLRGRRLSVEESNVMQSSPSIEGQALRIVRIEQVLQRTGLGRTTTHEFIAKGRHPAPIKLGRASRWVVQEIDSWMEQLVRQRGLLEGKRC
jgi:prophage regulatory protein